MEKNHINFSMKRLVLLFILFVAILLSVLTACAKKEEKNAIDAVYDISVAVEKDFGRIYVTENVALDLDLTEPLNELHFRMDSLLYDEGNKGAYFESEKNVFEGGETTFGGVSVNGIPVQPSITGNRIVIGLPEAVSSGELKINFGYTAATAESPSVYGKGTDTLKLFDCFPTLFPFENGQFSAMEFSGFSSDYLRTEAEYNMRIFTDNSVAIATDLPIINISEEELQTVTECSGRGIMPGAVLTVNTLVENGNVVTDNPELTPYATNAVSQYSAILDAPSKKVSIVSTVLRSDFKTAGTVVMINESLKGDRLIDAVYEGIAAVYFSGIAKTEDAVWVSEGIPHFLSEFRLKVSGNDAEYSERIASDKEIAKTVTEFLKGYNPNYVRYPSSGVSTFTTITEFYGVVRGGTAAAFDNLLTEYGEKKLTKALRKLCRSGALTGEEALSVLTDALGKSSGDEVRRQLCSDALYE